MGSHCLADRERQIADVSCPAPDEALGARQARRETGAWTSADGARGAEGRRQEEPGRFLLYACGSGSRDFYGVYKRAARENGRAGKNALAWAAVRCFGARWLIAVVVTIHRQLVAHRGAVLTTGDGGSTVLAKVTAGGRRRRDGTTEDTGESQCTEKAAKQKHDVSRRRLSFHETILFRFGPFAAAN